MGTVTEQRAAFSLTMAELRTHLATERVRVVTLRLKEARLSSIPTIVIPGGIVATSFESPAAPNTVVKL